MAKRLLNEWVLWHDLGIEQFDVGRAKGVDVRAPRSGPCIRRWTARTRKGNRALLRRLGPVFEG